MRPQVIRAFESLFLLGCAISAWQLVVEPRAPLAQLVGGLTLILAVALVLMVSRRQSVAAKWLLVTLFALGIAAAALRGFRGWGLLDLADAALSFAALALLFTPAAVRWLAEAYADRVRDDSANLPIRYPEP